MLCHVSMQWTPYLLDLDCNVLRSGIEKPNRMDTVRPSLSPGEEYNKNDQDYVMKGLLSNKQSRTTVQYCTPQRSMGGCNVHTWKVGSVTAACTWIPLNHAHRGWNTAPHRLLGVEEDVAHVPVLVPFPVPERSLGMEWCPAQRTTNPPYAPQYIQQSEMPSPCSSFPPVYRATT